MPQLRSAIPTVEVMEQRRERYHARVRQHVGAAFVDMAISAPGMHFILVTLAGRGARRVLDMGTGFSTIELMRSVQGIESVTAVDHDQAWLGFISGLTGELGEPGRFPRIRFVRRPPGDRSPIGGTPFDAIIVDHADGTPKTLDRRAEDTPWLTTMLAPGGIMFFDDWRPKHEGRIRRALGSMKQKWEIGAAEHTRRFPRDKAIGWAIRA